MMPIVTLGQQLTCKFLEFTNSFLFQISKTLMFAKLANIWRTQSEFTVHNHQIMLLRLLNSLSSSSTNCELYFSIDPLEVRKPKRQSNSSFCWGGCCGRFFKLNLAFNCHSPQYTLGKCKMQQKIVKQVDQHTSQNMTKQSYLSRGLAIHCKQTSARTPILSHRASTSSIECAENF